MRKLIWISIALWTTVSATAQPRATEDARANGIINALTRKSKTYKSFKAAFTIVMYGRDKKPTDTQQGSLLVEGSKYKLDIKNQTVICDSATIWTYLKDANEVQINNADPLSKSAITPDNIFTVYQKGFKKHFDGTLRQGAATMETVDLYPNHPEKEKYHTLKLVINKATYQITEIKVLMKDGTMVYYIINKFTPNVDLPASTFTFNKANYPGVEVEDLRD